MSFKSRLKEGARNLLENCAELRPEETLVIIREDPELGWYDESITNALFDQVRSMGIEPTLLEVGKPNNDKNSAAIKAVDRHDCTIFLARIGDQSRFESLAPGKKTIMCYVRDAQMLASTYGCANYKAFLHLKQAINDILLRADEIRITCGYGTDISGKKFSREKEAPSDVSVRRFPLGVPQPIDASGLSGRVALVNYLTPTGSKIYEPASIEINDVVFAHVESGKIVDFTGKKRDVNNIRNHYKKVSEQFNIQENNVHSFHAGIHPGNTYLTSAADDPDRWANTIFNNPRILHFHTCGNYPPGEICWMVIDQTLAVDDKNLWFEGRLRVKDFEQTRQCMEKWPELSPIFEHPAQAIGLV